MSKTFCIMPFVHLNLKQEGRVCACWRSHTNLGNSNNNSLTEIFNDTSVKELRKSLMNDETPEGCKSCWDMEDSGISSTRLDTLKNWKIINDEIQYVSFKDNDNLLKLKNWVNDNFDESFNGKISSLKSIEIRFDNICNLMCRHCSPVYSSLWETAVKKDSAMMEIMKDSGTSRTGNTHISLNDKIIDEIEILAPTLQEILITGGEPLYHKKHYEFLKKIEPYASNITLNYNSNFSVLTYGKDSILPLWEKFKHVGVLVSIDATPEIYSYVRVNGNIDKVEKNIKLAQSLENITLQATCTTSILNITKIVDVFKYFISLNVKIHASLVQWPVSLNPRVLPTLLKEQITTEFDYFIKNFDTEINPYLKDTKKRDYYFERISEVGNKLISYMNNKNMYDDQWNNTINFIKTQDHFNKTNVLDYYPEFRDFWK